ncbi:MAG: POTRA domain-containing protein [Bacteroidota bacterium]
MARIFLIIVLFAAFVSRAQEEYTLSFQEQNFSKLERWEGKTFDDSLDLLDFLERKRLRHVRKGYVLASVDSIRWKRRTAKVHYYRGPEFQSIVVRVPDSSRNVVQGIPGVNESMLRRTNFSAGAVAEILKDVGDHLLTHGFPFARVYFSVDEISAGQTTVNLMIEKGPLVKVQEIHIKGSTEVRKKFLTNAIAIQEGDLYDQKKFTRIELRIEQIQFLKQIRKHELLFTREGVELFLYLESNPVSLVNGILGLQPDPVTNENTITGDVRLKLQNVLHRGEVLDINWRSLQPTTQDLEMKFAFPFLFNTPFGIDSEFKLYKQDSSFLSTRLNLGIQYFLPGGNYVKVFYESDNSNLLSGATDNSFLDGNFSSVSTNLYGLGLYRRQLDYLPNPSRGFELDIQGGVGRRERLREDVDSTAVTTTFSSQLNVAAYIPFFQRHVLHLANTTRAYYAPEIFENEALRFGGLKTQRGFNEEELRATTLSTFTIEYRFLVDRNSHAFAFYDQTIYENASGTYEKDTPFGFGAGFSFGTNLGIFSISYAIGQQFDNPILIRDGKVHFGYVAFF